MWSLGTIRGSMLVRDFIPLITLMASARTSSEEEDWICKSLVCHCSIAKSILSKWVVNGGALSHRLPTPKLLRPAFKHSNRFV